MGRNWAPNLFLHFWMDDLDFFGSVKSNPKQLNRSPSFGRYWDILIFRIFGRFEHFKVRGCREWSLEKPPRTTENLKYPGNQDYDGTGLIRFEPPRININYLTGEISIKPPIATMRMHTRAHIQINQLRSQLNETSCRLENECTIFSDLNNQIEIEMENRKREENMRRCPAQASAVHIFLPYNEARWRVTKQRKIRK